MEEKYFIMYIWRRFYNLLKIRSEYEVESEGEKWKEILRGEMLYRPF